MCPPLAIAIIGVSPALAFTAPVLGAHDMEVLSQYVKKGIGDKAGSVSRKSSSIVPPHV